MAVDAQSSYSRRAVVEPEPPPASGAAPARTRARLFDGPFNTALTLVSTVIIVALVWPTVKFLFVDAVWTDRAASIASQKRWAARSARAGRS